MSEFGKRNPLPTTSQRETAGPEVFEDEEKLSSRSRPLTWWTLLKLKWRRKPKPKPRPDSWAEDVARKQHEQNNLP